MLWLDPTRRCSKELLIVEVAVHAPVDLIHDRLRIVRQPQRAYKGRNALLTVEQVANQSGRTRIDI